MYINIKSDLETKQYILTESYSAKPYLNVSGSVLPLTTSTTSGLHLGLSVGEQTYRPLEYKSASASATYYTSALNSEGLSSVTALTRASTSDVSYETRASTSGTNYGTRASTSGTSYGTKGISKYPVISSSYYYIAKNNWGATSGKFSSTESSIAITSFSTISYLSSSTATISYSGVKTTRSLYYYSINSGTWTWSSSSSASGSTSRGNTLTTRSTSGSATETYTSSRLKFDQFMGPGPFSSNSTTVWYGYTRNQSGCTSVYTLSYYSNAQSSWSIQHSEICDMVSLITQTTGTTYLTRSSTSGTTYLTRSSTSNTIYLTRSSTSGYSGVSSSSSESSGWV